MWKTNTFIDFFIVDGNIFWFMKCICCPRILGHRVFINWNYGGGIKKTFVVIECVTAKK